MHSCVPSRFAAERPPFDASMYELSKSFLFDAAHTLRRDIQAEGSRRIHGHSYRATVVLVGEPDPESGMLIDLGVLAAHLEAVRDRLDHHFLDEVEGLGPATLENLAHFIWLQLQPVLMGLSKVVVSRDLSGESCSFSGRPGSMAS